MIVERKIVRNCGSRLFGVHKISSLSIKNYSFENCSFGYNGSHFFGNRDNVSDSLFEHCRISKCVLGPAIIRRSRIVNLMNDMLICWGTLFDEVILTGNLGPIMLHGIPTGFPDKSKLDKYKKISSRFYENVEFALDISNAQFSDFSIRTSAIPLALIRRDLNTQFIVSNPNAEVETIWINSLAISDYTKMMFRLMADDAMVENLLVAPKLDLDMYSIILRDAEVLEKHGMLR